MSSKAVTSKHVATEASELLRSNKTAAKPKSVAGSALAQAPDQKDSILKRLSIGRYRSGGK